MTENADPMENRIQVVVSNRNEQSAQVLKQDRLPPVLIPIPKSKVETVPQMQSSCWSTTDGWNAKNTATSDVLYRTRKDMVPPATRPLVTAPLRTATKSPWNPTPRAAPFVRRRDFSDFSVECHGHAVSLCDRFVVRRKRPVRCQTLEIPVPMSHMKMRVDVKHLTAAESYTGKASIKFDFHPDDECVLVRYEGWICVVDPKSIQEDRRNVVPIPVESGVKSRYYDVNSLVKGKSAGIFIDFYLWIELHKDAACGSLYFPLLHSMPKTFLTATRMRKSNKGDEGVTTDFLMSLEPF